MKVRLFFADRPEPVEAEVGSADTVEFLNNQMDGEIENWAVVCRGCGCDDWNACPGGCYWAEEDLCSECAEKAAVP